MSRRDRFRQARNERADVGDGSLERTGHREQRGLSGLRAAAARHACRRAGSVVAPGRSKPVQGSPTISAGRPETLKVSKPTMMARGTAAPCDSSIGLGAPLSPRLSRTENNSQRFRRPLHNVVCERRHKKLTAVRSTQWVCDFSRVESTTCRWWTRQESNLAQGLELHAQRRPVATVRRPRIDRQAASHVIYPPLT